MSSPRMSLAAKRGALRRTWPSHTGSLGRPESEPCIPFSHAASSYRHVRNTPTRLPPRCCMRVPRARRRVALLPTASDRGEPASPTLGPGLSAPQLRRRWGSRWAHYAECDKGLPIGQLRGSDCGVRRGPRVLAREEVGGLIRSSIERAEAGGDRLGSG